MLPSVSEPSAKPTQARRGRRRRAGARARRAFVEVPRVLGLPAEPDVVERERAQAELGHQHRARVGEPAHDGGVGRRHAVAVRLGAPGRRDAGGVDEILGAPRHAVQRAAVLAARELGVGAARGGERVVARDGDAAQELRLVALEPLEVERRQPLGAQLLRLDPARQRRQRGERDVLVARRQRRRGAARAHEARLFRAGRGPRRAGGGGRVPHRRRHVRVAERDLARADAPLEERRHRVAPIGRRLRALLLRHRHLRQLLRLGERRRRHLRPRRRRGPERRRRGRLRRRGHVRGRLAVRALIRRALVPCAFAARAPPDGDARQPQRRAREELPPRCAHWISSRSG